MNALMLYKRWGVDAAVTATGGNGPDGTQNYVAVTIQSSEVPSALSDFPVYVRLSDLPAAFWSSVQSDGGDIRVTEDDGTTRAPVDLEAIDTGSDEGELHFLASSVSASSNTTYRVYYNATSTLSQPAVGDTYGRNAVWADYEGVWHLGEDPSGTAPQAIDSTGGGHHGSAAGDPTTATGQIGSAVNFDGSGDYLDMGTSDLDVANDLTFTFSLWVNPTTITGLHAIGGKATFDSDTDEYGFAVNTNLNGAYRALMRDANNNSVQVEMSSAAQTGTWALLHAVSDGSNLTIYEDATAGGSESVSGMTPDTSGNPFRLAEVSDVNTGLFFLDGALDEARARSSAVSADWISAEHTNQNAPTTFYSVGSEQSA